MPDTPDISWVDEHLHDDGGFPRADWPAVRSRMEATVPEGRWHATWDAAAQLWLHRTAESLGPDCRVLKSRNFLLLAPGLEGDEEVLLRFLEHAHGKLLSTLPGIATGVREGRHAFVILDSEKIYYEYVDWFLPPGGRYPFSGGMCLPDGYGHVAFPWKDLGSAEVTAAHELSHACVAHVGMPQWLDEGIASVFEGVAAGKSSRLLSAEDVRDQRDYWNAETIQALWSGDSFHQPLDGFELGYTVGYLVVKSISGDMARFREFVHRARPEDAGEAAFREVYGGSLGQLVTPLLGPGDWRPRPESWESRDEEESRETPST